MGRALRGAVFAVLALTPLGGALAAPAKRAVGVPFVEIRRVAPDIALDIRYATPNNVFKRRLYNSDRALLRKPVAERLARAQARLRKQGYGLKIWDAYRPHSVQYVMWRIRPGTRYLANPRKGSKHNRGAAIDVTLVDRNGRDLAMPTPFDEFSPRAHRNATKGISKAAQRHRAILAAALQAEGFMQNPYEWWHFTARDWSRYPMANVPAEKLP